MVSLTPGGSERALTTMANHWAKKGLEVTILTHDDGSHPPFFQLHQAVRHVPMGNVLLEAMACGVPPISSDRNSSPRDVIRHGVDGILVPPLDVRSSAKEMKRLLNDEEERNRLATRALEIRQKFSVEKITKMWGEAVSDAIRKRGIADFPSL